MHSFECSQQIKIGQHKNQNNLNPLDGRSRLANIIASNKSPLSNNESGSKS